MTRKPLILEGLRIKNKVSYVYASVCAPSCLAAVPPSIGWGHALTQKLLQPLRLSTTCGAVATGVYQSVGAGGKLITKPVANVANALLATKSG